MGPTDMFAHARISRRQPCRTRPTCPHHLLLAAMLGGVLSILPSNARAGQQPPQPAPAAPSSATPLARVLDLDTATLAIRYRAVSDGADTLRTNQVQTQATARGHVLFDEAGRYALGFTVQTANGFPSSWNSTGIGTGDATWSVYVKHLYGQARPAPWLEMQYGGLFLVHGENSEATAYDNDGYVEGGRVTVRRPDWLGVDQLTVTLAYLGDTATSNVFRRLDRLDQQNFRQILVAKQFGTRVRASTDYVDEPIEGRVLRQAAHVELGTHWIDGFRAEYAVRVSDRPHEVSLILTGERTRGRLSLYGGYAHIGTILGSLSGDRYAPGSRLFTGGSWRLPADVSLSWFLQHELNAPPTTRNKVRFDFICAWNTRPALRRAGLVR